MFILKKKRGRGGFYSKNIIRIIMYNKRLWLIRLQIYNIQRWIIGKKKVHV